MDEHIGHFLRTLEGDRGFSQNTVAAYRNDLNQFASYLHGETKLTSWAELSNDYLTSYILYLREKEYANSTVARKVAAVRSFCHYLIEQGMLRHDPAAELPSPKVDKFVPRAISHEEITALLEQPGQMGSPEGLRDKAMLETLYATGMRVSELTALDVDDIDLDQGQLRCGKKPDRSRWVPLASSALEAIRKYRDEGRKMLPHDDDEPALFLNHRGNRLTRQGFWLILKAYAEAANISDITPHTIRHTYAAHALGRGDELRDVQRVLGHMSISTTQIYQQVASVVPNSANGHRAETPVSVTADGRLNS